MKRRVNTILRALVIGMAVACMTSMMGCDVESLPSQLLVEKHDKELAWVSGMDPRIPGNFTMPVSYDPALLNVGDIREVTVHIRNGDSVPLTDYLTVTLPYGIDLVGEKGVDFIRYTEDMHDWVIGTPPGAPQWLPLPQYAIYIPPHTQKVNVTFQVIQPSVSGAYQINFRKSVWADESQRGTYGHLTALYYRQPGSVNLRDSPLRAHPSQWDRFTDEFLAGLDYKLTDPAVVLPKTLYYNLWWNVQLAFAHQNENLGRHYEARARALAYEVLPNGKAVREEYNLANLDTYAKWAFPDDYPSREIREELIRSHLDASIEGGWPDE